MADYVASLADYKTDKTYTRSIAVFTETGVLSLKIVETANGHKTDLYTGFDPQANVLSALSDHEDNEDPRRYLREHKYYRADKKAAEKWKGAFSELSISPERLLEQFDVLSMLGGKALSHWVEAFGSVPTDEEIRSAKLKASNDATQRIAAENAAALARKQDLLRSDPSWGMF